MRNTIPLIIAVALTGATPAAAQGTDNSVNADTAAATAANDTAAADNVANDSAMMANDMTAAPPPISRSKQPTPNLRRPGKAAFHGVRWVARPGRADAGASGRLSKDAGLLIQGAASS